MKKFLGVVSVALACITLFACNNNNTAQVKLASQKISTNLDSIIKQVKKMEEFDNEKLNLDDLIDNYVETDSNDEYYNDYLDYQKINQKDMINSTRSRYYQNRDNLEMDFIVPTQSKVEKSTLGKMDFNTQSDRNFRKRNLNFVSKETSNTYGDLKSVSNACQNSNDNYISAKKELIENCYQAKTLLDRLKSGEKQLSNTELKTLNSYYDVFKQCLSNIQGCQSCKKTVNNLGRKKTNLASNCGTMNADYLKISNCLDTNYTCCNNANNSVVDLIKFLNKVLDVESSTKNTNNFVNNNRYLSKVNNIRNRGARQNSNYYPEYSQENNEMSNQNNRYQRPIRKNLQNSNIQNNKNTDYNDNRNINSQTNLRNPQNRVFEDSNTQTLDIPTEQVSNVQNRNEIENRRNALRERTRRQNISKALENKEKNQISNENKIVENTKYQNNEMNNTNSTQGKQQKYPHASFYDNNPVLKKDSENTPKTLELLENNTVENVENQNKDASVENKVDEKKFDNNSNITQNQPIRKTKDIVLDENGNRIEEQGIPYSYRRTNNYQTYKNNIARQKNHIYFNTDKVDNGSQNPSVQTLPTNMTNLNTFAPKKVRAEISA